jgi:hypothetical protein
MRAKFPLLPVKLLKYKYPNTPFNNTVLSIPFLLRTRIFLNFQLDRSVLKSQCKIHSTVRFMYIYSDILLIALFNKRKATLAGAVKMHLRT